MTATPAPNGNITHEQRFELLVSGIRDYAIYLIDPQGYISSWNTGAERFKGYTAQEVIGTHFSQFYTPEDRAAGLPARALATALAEGKFESEGWRVRKDGTRFWANVVIDPVYAPDGSLVGFAKITRDITEQRLMQEELLASEQRFRILVQGVTDYAIYMLSPAGQVTNWNAGAERIKGYAAHEVIGQSFGMFYTPEEQAAGRPQQVLAQAARDGKFEGEGWRMRKDGTRFWAHVVLDAIRDEHGQLIGFAKITRDITEKRAAGEALEQARAALFQSQKMEAIGQLTGGIAHDFNNLLSVLSSGLDLIRTQYPGDRKVLESMRRAIDRGSTMTQQLLSFARQQPLAPTLHNLNQLIMGFEAVLQRALSSAIHFELDLSTDIGNVLVDEARFEAALLNLVVNARDAMPDGGQLHLTTANVSLATHQVGTLPPGRYVRICLADTGTGMPPEVRRRVFEPFFTTKPVGRGTGLGLAQVHGFIAQSGGDIEVESAVGQGTTFRMYLPVYDGVAEEPAPHTDLERVLIVEDEPDLMDVAAELFRSLGYEVLTAANGHDALKILERTPNIDVLFSDIMMPGMSGVELAAQVKDQYPATKIVLASGYPQPALLAADMPIDRFTFVSKPYRLSEIIKRLR
ncbi:PAS domain-containing sensor histidine kinase [Massilia arenosa]|uniref:histidine kinase n=1 Tax=Zemynaea arenosa TaxID=2561931 RepID=A0A4Y9SMM9_9BURK|nr:PAS domain-containing sensor histidine kinase [Massilia arenosa]TFW25551.1 PAS domain-containing sensor histidine kinase [Massilia arenosa]